MPATSVLSLARYHVVLMAYTHFIFQLSPWSSTMPLYACNLGLQPLEPVKTEHQSAAILLSPTLHSKTVPEEIPSAQFDWKGSGLENPLTGILVNVFVFYPLFSMLPNLESTPHIVQSVDIFFVVKLIKTCSFFSGAN